MQDLIVTRLVFVLIKKTEITAVVQRVFKSDIQLRRIMFNDFSFIRQTFVRRNTVRVAQERKPRRCFVIETVGVKMRAALGNMHERKTRMIKGRFQRAGQMIRDPVGGGGHERRAQTKRDTHGIKRIDVCPLRLGHRRMRPSGRRRRLILGERVKLVIIHHKYALKVFVDAVDQVIAADAHGVPVAGMHKQIQIRTGQGHAERNRDRASVDSVHAVGIKIIRRTARTADAGNVNRLSRLDLPVDHETLKAHDDAEIPASGLHMKIVYPLPLMLKDIFKNYKRIVTVEVAYGDAYKPAPLAMLLRNETCVDVTSVMSNATGRPLRPRTIVGAIKEALK